MKRRSSPDQPEHDTSTRLQLRRRHRLAGTVAGLAVLGAGLGVGYGLLVPSPPSATAYDFVSFDASSAKADDPFAGSPFVLQRMSSYVSLASSDVVLTDVKQSLGLSQSVADLRDEVTAISPPNTTYVQIQVADSKASTAERIAKAVSIRWISPS